MYSSNFDVNDKRNSCHCAFDCKYCYYDDRITGFDHNEKIILVDVHYGRPTGIRYKENLVVSDLDILGIMIVQCC